MDFSGHFRLMARLPATGGKMGKKVLIASNIL
jgi:hypothetical protein